MNINEIIQNHALWLETDGKEGSRVYLYGANMENKNLYGVNLTRANLHSANLEGANLRSANLYGAIGDLKHIKSIFCDTYPVTYTAEVMQIGCQRHKLEDWWGFYDSRIFDMDGERALTWWRIWKPILQQIIATSPATATGHVDLTCTHKCI